MSRSFIEDMMAHAGARDFSRHPFVTALNRGEYEAAALAAFAGRLYQMAESFVQVLARIFVICPDPAVRANLLENLAEENGLYVGAEACRLCFDAARRHPELLRKFARSVGTADELLHWAPDRAVVSSWLESALARGDWIGALAYVAVGQESNGPLLVQGIVRGLRDRYGCDDQSIESFTLHITADVGHGAAGARLIDSVARTDAERRGALVGARRGADALWAIYRVFDRELRLNGRGETSVHAYGAE